MTQRKALNRKPDLSVKKTMTLADGTSVAVINITARKSIELINNKALSDADRGVHITAAKLLINGQPIVADDLLDSFTADELTEIMEFANDLTDDNGKNA